MTEFGTDLSWTWDVDPAHRLVSGAELVAQACFRRLITPRGALLDDPDYGLDLRAELSRAQTREYTASLPGRIEAELRKDPRVLAVAVEIEALAGFGNYEIAINGTCSEGPFELVVGVAEAAILLRRSTP